MINKNYKVKDLVGKNVRITDNRAGHGIPLGTVFQIYKTSIPNPESFITDSTQLYAPTNISLCYFRLSEVEFAEDTIASIKKSISELTDKLKFMEESHIETFDEKKYKIYKLTKIMEDKKLSREDKSNAIYDFTESL